MFDDLDDGPPAFAFGRVATPAALEDGILELLFEGAGHELEDTHWGDSFWVQAGAWRIVEQ